MLDGVMLLWFLLTALSVLFVAVDIRSTPESPVLKWGFVLLTAYTGPLGAFLYVLGCREPLSGLHEQYVAVRWRQVLGSTMHCCAGDGVGILAGAVFASLMHFSDVVHVVLEYLLGFGFGWTIFQALFMRDMMGGSYKRSLAKTFFPELLSMNLLMAGMIPTMILTMKHVPDAHHPADPAFWFLMSMSLLVGFLTAYPINWWLVAKHMKHGMMTVRVPQSALAQEHRGGQESPIPSSSAHRHAASADQPGMSDMGKVAPAQLAWMTLLSFLALAAGAAIAAIWGGAPMALM
ncbi:DUF4396 domain-containing protein [Dyella sp.]|uniref:DUF4396 domain-containing protein n=1 Tax=Dyella sp. TaxID=1869338 RepID=UPI002C53EB3E|nr:DUF4396 domain-containing protein [Rhodanobacteraceae bacterium]